MREIKFRAWDKANEEMYYDNERVLQSLAITAQYRDKVKIIEFMQYTGLKDKQDKLIYEGDIVKCFKVGNSVVNFSYGCFGLTTNHTFHAFNDIYGEIEVIGNIYENPELLNFTY